MSRIVFYNAVFTPPMRKLTVPILISEMMLLWNVGNGLDHSVITANAFRYIAMVRGTVKTVPYSDWLKSIRLQWCAERSTPFPTAIGLNQFACNDARNGQDRSLQRLA
jgi:hypothetical protein